MPPPKPPANMLYVWDPPTPYPYVVVARLRDHTLMPMESGSTIHESFETPQEAHLRAEDLCSQGYWVDCFYQIGYSQGKEA